MVSKVKVPEPQLLNESFRVKAPRSKFLCESSWAKKVKIEFRLELKFKVPEFTVVGLRFLG